MPETAPGAGAAVARRCARRWGASRAPGRRRREVARSGSGRLPVEAHARCRGTGPRCAASVLCVGRTQARPYIMPGIIVWASSSRETAPGAGAAVARRRARRWGASRAPGRRRREVARSGSGRLPVEAHARCRGTGPRCAASVLCVGRTQARPYIMPGISDRHIGHRIGQRVSHMVSLLLACVLGVRHHSPMMPQVPTR